jgi:hypothetical protein
MAHVKAQFQIPHDSGLPEDVTINTFHFNVGTVGTAAYNSINTNLSRFYSVAGTTSGAAVDDFLSAVIAGTYNLDLYLMTDPEPRSPVATYSGTLTPGTGKALPSEVALVASFQGTPTSGQIQARRRGRVYIGPLDADAADSAGTRPAQQLIDTLTEVSERLMTECTASAIPWIVYSPTGSLFTAVTNGWVDNSFDTQRRRGEAATARYTWS